MFLENEWPQTPYTYRLQQKWGRIQQKLNSYDMGK